MKNSKNYHVPGDLLKTSDFNELLVVIEDFESDDESYYGDEDSDWGLSDSDDDWYESETEIENRKEAEEANPSKSSKYLLKSFSSSVFTSFLSLCKTA